MILMLVQKAGDLPAKRRKRAPIPAPAFEPLLREPWEDRLDAALQGI